MTATDAEPTSTHLSLRRRFDHGAGQACATRAPKLGAAMTLDQAITHAAAKAAVAMSNGEDQQVAEWSAEVTRLLDQRDALEREFAAHAESMREWAETSLHCATFDELKGSPDHSVVRHA